MAAFRRYLWIGALLFGIGFLAIGGTFVVMGNNARLLIRDTLATEKVVTSKDAERFGVAAGLPVVDATTARAQAQVIDMHLVDQAKGRYAELGKDDPGRNVWKANLPLVNSLNMAVLSFGVAQLAMGVGAILILLGTATMGLLAPALYWLREPETEPARQGARRLSPAKSNA